MHLQGKVALVTGAAKRVGRAIAVALARRGAKLAIHCNRSRREAEALKRDLERAYGTEAAVLAADLGDPRQVKRLAAQALRRFGRVDVLVNSASIYEKQSFGKATPRDWDAHMDVNARAPFLLAQELGPAMRRAGAGKIVNIADWAAKRPYVGYAAYCASKAALLCVNAALAKALAPEVQVNAVLPGPVMLPEGLGAKEREAVRQATLVKRLGRPEDVAAAVAFLVEGSDFVTGAELTVDGGRLIA